MVRQDKRAHSGSMAFPDVSVTLEHMKTEQITPLVVDGKTRCEVSSRFASCP